MEKFSNTVAHVVWAMRKKMPLLQFWDKAVFLCNLSFCYQFMVASHHLAECARDRSDGKLKEYFAKHAEEEKDHDEWLKADLKSASFNVESLPINPYAEQMAGTQYYNIFHVHPSSLLGYMAFLEMFPMPLEVVKTLEGLHGENLLRTLKFHAIHDRDHAKDLCNVLDEIDPTHHELILHSVMKTAEYFSAALQQFVSAKEVSYG